MRSIAGALILAAFSGLGSSPTEAKVVLTFGTYAPDKPSAMVAQLRPTLDAIAREATAVLGEEVEIRMQLVKGYEAGVALIVNGEADFTRLGPASYIFAKDENDGLTVLAMENKNGAKSFDGVIAVHRDSTLTEVSQLRGRSFAFGSKRSTLGRYFSQLTLMQAGLLARDLKRYEYLGRHDKVGRAVGSGLFDAGALEETTFQKLVDKGVPIRALTKFSNSTRPWVARAGLDQRVRDALRQALLNVDDRGALRALRFDGFFEGNDSDYEPTRDAIRRNPQFFAQLQ
ncbi:PhnD/SsuA/transferrin family substrate-binding protein [Pelagibius litoralis]|uniref:PhnD/SsuA/transferrin family substrate-binding protein n=1 Tax=Pelagibius litoralis TaxID=374515 RepID=A0A967EVN4_9PROT|nr:PhnD/SsuA/transferrin family substrate-binding protein [Pelagibius litoralis]NIA68089.1 PhnD/SsuA/transferrin family substrate-binding protein [Pelagibius litoralis]